MFKTVSWLAFDTWNMWKIVAWLAGTVRLCTSCLHGAIRLPHLSETVTRHGVTRRGVTRCSCGGLGSDSFLGDRDLLSIHHPDWKHCHDDAERHEYQTRDTTYQDLGIENHAGQHDQHTFLHFYTEYKHHNYHIGYMQGFAALPVTFFLKIALALLWCWYWSSSLHLLLCWN